MQCPTSLHDQASEGVEDNRNDEAFQCKCGCFKFSVLRGKLMCHSCDEAIATVVPLATGELLDEIKKEQNAYKDTLCMVLEGVVPILEACAEAVPQYKFSVVQYTIALRGHILELKRK
jgi:hypothetical protein